MRQQTRLLNQLTAALKAYYPRALEVVDDLTSRWGREFLRVYATPGALATLRASSWQRWAREHRLGAERVATLWALIERPQLAVPEHVVRVHARRVGALLAQLEVTVGAVAEYRGAIADFFAGLPAAEWARSLPGGQSGTTVPRLYAELGDAVGRWQTFRHLQGHAGVVPVTDRSGKGTWCASGSPATAAARRRAPVGPEFADGQRRVGAGLIRPMPALGAPPSPCPAGPRRQVAQDHLRPVRRQVPYDERHHLATMARQHLRQPA